MRNEGSPLFRTGHLRPRVVRSGFTQTTFRRRGESTRKTKNLLTREPAPTMRTVNLSSLCPLLALLFLAATADNLLGQRVSDLYGAEAAHPEAGVGPVSASPIALFPWQDVFPADSGPSWQSRIFTSLAGAVVGMGVGYFFSEVVESDWNESSGGNEANRPLWAAVGGGVGLALGFSFPITGPGGDPSGIGGLGGEQRTIPTEEIGTISATNAFDVVRLLRPGWLLQLGQGALYDSRTNNIMAYLDSQLLGRLEELPRVSTAGIRSIRFIPARQADIRWGPGHTQGVIQVITRQ